MLSAAALQLTNTLVIAGTERVVTKLTPTPPAGTVVPWKALRAARSA